MRLRFSRPKGPGFGISASTYLSVLASRPTLPSILELINPDGVGGAVSGFGAPLAQHSERAALTAPMSRGAYAMARKDRKTVLKVLVLSKEEAAFDPEVFALSDFARTFEPEVLARVRATWTLIQFSFESHDPDVYPALDFLLDITSRMAELTEGVVADPICRRYRLPTQVQVADRVDPLIDARDHVAIASRPRPEGEHAYSLGMQKFGLPELEMVALRPSDLPDASRLLLLACQQALLGTPLVAGDRFGAVGAPFITNEAGFDETLWRGLPVLELRPPTTLTPGEALTRWRAELGK